MGINPIIYLVVGMVSAAVCIITAFATVISEYRKRIVARLESAALIRPESSSLRKLLYETRTSLPKSLVGTIAHRPRNRAEKEVGAVDRMLSEVLSNAQRNPELMAIWFAVADKMAQEILKSVEPQSRRLVVRYDQGIGQGTKSVTSIRDYVHLKGNNESEFTENPFQLGSKIDAAARG